MHFKIDWDNLIVGTKFTVFALFYFVFEGNFTSTSPLGAYIGRVDLTGGGFVLPVWGAYIWRGLYMEGLIFRILQYCITIPKERIYCPTTVFFEIQPRKRGLMLVGEFF